MSRLNTMARFAPPSLPPKIECELCHGLTYYDNTTEIEVDNTTKRVCEYCERDVDNE